MTILELHSLLLLHYILYCLHYKSEPLNVNIKQHTVPIWRHNIKSLNIIYLLFSIEHRTFILTLFGAVSLLMKLLLLPTPFLLLYLSVVFSRKMKMRVISTENISEPQKIFQVISTDPGASLPAKDGRAELMTSWLGEYSELTLCARQAGPLSLVGILQILCSDWSKS